MRAAACLCASGGHFAEPTVPPPRHLDGSAAARARGSSTVTPPTQFARPAEEQGKAITLASAAAVAAVAGGAIGIGAKVASNLGKRDDEDAAAEARRGENKPG